MQVENFSHPFIRKAKANPFGNISLLLTGNSHFEKGYIK